jgi:hypothetical protein
MPMQNAVPVPIRSIARRAEDLRLGLDGLDAAAAAIAAGMRANTLDPDGVYQLLHMTTRALKADADALIAAVGQQ